MSGTRQSDVQPSSKMGSSGLAAARAASGGVLSATFTVRASAAAGRSGAAPMGLAMLHCALTAAPAGAASVRP